MIPVNEPTFSGRELEYVTECIQTGWVSSSGRFIEMFEAKWAEYCGRKYGIAVSNGTAALHTAVAALGIGAGDEVIMPTFTIISCAIAVIACGGIPVLVDSDANDWNICVSQIEARISEKTRAIMVVHTYGHPVNMDAIYDIARRRGVKIIEDAAQAHGAEYRTSLSDHPPTWARCGGFGDISCFSFFGNKIVVTGEGGMVLTDDVALAERCRAFRNLCFQAGRRFYHEELGFNYRMTNLQAALGVAQVECVERTLERKRWLGAAYTERLKGFPSVRLQCQMEWAKSVYWMYGVVISPETGRDAAIVGRALQDRGIETRPFFLGMHEQPVLQRRGWYRGEVYPVAEHLARQGLYLPSGITLDEGQMDTICSSLQEVLS